MKKEVALMSKPRDPKDDAKDANEKSLHTVKKLSPNVYEISFGRKTSPAATAPSNPYYSSTRVLKAGDIKDSDVQTFAPKKIVTSEPTGDSGIQGLRKNLQHLNTLHDRLKFMLKELEEYVVE